MPFDKMTDSIAITVPRFKLLKSRDGGAVLGHRRANEPYLVTLAVDSRGTDQPKIQFNTAFYPEVYEGDVVTMLGDGHLVYAPANPGEWVAVSVLLMESDADVRARGKAMMAAVSSIADDQGLKTLLATNPTALAVSTGLFMLAKVFAKHLENDGDDAILRAQGVYLRDRPVPYDVNRMVTRSNSGAEIDVKVIPLTAPNGQGPTPSYVEL